MKQHTKDSLVKAIEEDERWHFTQLKRLAAVQWTTTIVVAITGALTTFAGTDRVKETFMAQPESLLVVGIITAVGVAINQGINFSNGIANHRTKALAHRMIREALQYTTLTIEAALKLRRQVVENPENALKEFSERYAPDGGDLGATAKKSNRN